MIPPKVHQIVLGHVRPPQISKYISGWRKFPACTYHRWDDLAIEHMFQESFPEYFDCYRQCRNRSEASDIARLAILYLHGGYYIDWDIELVDPAAMSRFMEAHCNEDGWGVVDSRNNTLATELYASAPRSEVVMGFLRHLCGIPLEERPPSPQFGGPWGLTAWYRQSGYRLRLFETGELFRFRYKYVPCPPGNQPLIHHWMHTWIEGSPYYSS
jgi:hypothetical protein